MGSGHLPSCSIRHIADAATTPFDGTGQRWIHGDDQHLQLGDAVETTLELAQHSRTLMLLILHLLGE